MEKDYERITKQQKDRDKEYKEERSIALVSEIEIGHDRKNERNTWKNQKDKIKLLYEKR